ncbi:MAG: basic amino acid/polyamine antiporter [Firmicutes bacterium]|nr:basic amino acid/polyamine antiporter [Bacillota bacterium]MDY5771772.1 basic amino acid/polyamine antiporter [Anaerovoracaceae bacterium]
MNESQKQLSALSLIAVIIGSTIGSGIFTITADMAAAGAHTGAILIGWLICGIGMFGLMMCYFGLNKVRPDLTNGVYSYAGEGFGEYIGFTSAWGYWVSALLCNVSYLTLLFGAIGYFIPAFGTGNNLLSIVCASLLLWLVNYLVLRGMQEAALINIVTTIAKLVPLLVFVVAVIFVRAFDPAIFMNNFWGDGTMALGDQVKATTSATVWSFIGIEGAVVLSGRARRASDVGKASITAFIGILAIYVMTAVLSLGVMTTEEMSALPTPQMAGILEYAVGPWGAALINIGVILSLAGALLGWTILAADCPYSAAQQGGFMKAFSLANRHGSPVFSLFLTNGLIQLFLVICYFSASTYQAFYALSTSMIMIPYLLSAAYYLKLSIRGRGFEEPGSGSIAIESNTAAPGGSRAVALVFAVIGTLYGFWMLYSGGLDYVLITTVLYAPGLLVFIRGRHEKNLPIFTRKTEKAAAAAILILAVISIYMMAAGKLNPF